jgi:hypothetical protein
MTFRTLLEAQILTALASGGGMLVIMISSEYCEL